MARGDMKNFGDKSHKLTKEDNAKGGRKSAETRKRMTALKECLEILLAKDMGKGADGQPITGAEAMAMRAMNSALKGDWRAWELVRDTAGQKPVDKVVVADVDDDLIKEVEEMVNEVENSADEGTGA